MVQWNSTVIANWEFLISDNAVDSIILTPFIFAVPCRLQLSWGSCMTPALPAGMAQHYYRNKRTWLSNCEIMRCQKTNKRSAIKALQIEYEAICGWIWEIIELLFGPDLSAQVTSYTKPELNSSFRPMNGKFDSGIILWNFHAGLRGRECGIVLGPRPPKWDISHHSEGKCYH